MTVTDLVRILGAMPRQDKLRLIERIDDLLAEKREDPVPS